MANKEQKIPTKFRNFVDPILMENEEIICSFRESFKLDFDWDTLFPQWLVLTNLRLLILARELPGIRVDEYHLFGMNVDLFRDNVGFYDAIEFRSGSNLLHRVTVFRRRRDEATGFVHQVAEAITRLDFGQAQQSESDNNEFNSNDQKKCETDRKHLKDLEKMGAISDAEYKEEESKPCK